MLCLKKWTTLTLLCSIGILVVLVFANFQITHGKPSSSCRSRRHATPPPTTTINNLTVAHNARFKLRLSSDGSLEIPGLYDAHEFENGVITPVQGVDQFNELVLGRTSGSINCSDTTATLKQAGRNQVLSLVQFYMATCPDCQGFSRYFKRFVADIGPHWRRLIRIFVVNCNDEQNIYLCQEQNPKIIVPMIRWYKMPIIQQDTIMAATTNSSSCPSLLGFRKDALSVPHRQFIDEQRRDHIALRRASLKYIDMMLDELARNLELRNNSTSELVRANREILLDSLPARWHQLEQLERRPANRSLEAELQLRLERCVREVDVANTSQTVEQFIVLEPRTSYIGRTIIADWSQIACTASLTNRTVLLIHRSTDPSITRTLPAALEMGDLKLLHLNTTLVEVRTRRHAPQQSRPQRIQQRASLERLYLNLGAQLAGTPTRYAAAMTNANLNNGHLLHRREIATGSAGQKPATSEPDYNWKPESMYPSEERIRFAFNQFIHQHLSRAHNLTSLPGALLNGTHPGELAKYNSTSQVRVVDRREDDLTLMYLTDYYKGLDVIVHTDLLAKAELDGFQLLSSCCFLRQLKLHFPWQGNAHGSAQIGSRSIARHYVERLGELWFSELKQAIGTMKARNSTTTSSPDTWKHQHSNKLLDANLSEVCSSPEIAELNKEKLEQVRISARQLEVTQRKNLPKELGYGLAPEKLLKWNYCAGSSPFLRSHTCSLWILFHTLTVHEYLQTAASLQLQPRSNQSEEYQFQIDYSKAPRLPCDPKSPDNGLLETSNSRLYINSTRHALANIINFVRFYLPCTNCAAHFSCMVNHSPGLHFDSSVTAQPADAHLLWLWEGHNRVNVRTRATHSEDPTRPKHVFPSYDACPECYLEQPDECDGSNFTKMRFNRHELVKFLVARYRKSAILNNKLNIEDLFHRTTT